MYSSEDNSFNLIFDDSIKAFLFCGDQNGEGIQKRGILCKHLQRFTLLYSRN